MGADLKAGRLIPLLSDVLARQVAHTRMVAEWLANLASDFPVSSEVDVHIGIALATKHSQVRQPFMNQRSQIQTKLVTVANV